ncbi:MAG: long-chain fatty acid--CoA ligase, partial [Acidimicrobiales bacterium]
IDADGFVWINVRADQDIIRGGFLVRPGVVRAAVEGHPGVRGAAVIGVPDPRLGAVPVAVVEPRPAPASSVLTEADLLAYAETRLARYELPTRVLFVNELPRTESGKVDLTAVLAIVDHAASGAGLSPRRQPASRDATRSADG